MEIHSVGLVGGGKMSSEIFKLICEQDLNVVLWMRRPEAAAAGEEELLRKLRRRAKKAGEEGARAQERLRRLTITSDLNALRDVDLIIESVAENREVKLEMFSQLDKVVKPGAILTSNTSSLSPSAIARVTSRPEWCAGLHFFYPVSLLSFVEIIPCQRNPGHETRADVIEALEVFLRRIGRRPIGVKKEVAAYVINRVLAGYYHEGAGIVGEGYWLPGDVDKAGRKFAMMGPCESIDHAGVDVVVNGNRGADESWGEKNYVRNQTRGQKNFPPIYEQLFEGGRLGIKAGVGYYRYENRMPVEDPAYYQRVCSGLADYHSVEKGDEQAITDRLWMSLVLEAALTLQRGIGSAEDIDSPVKEILGLERGPLAWVAHVGPAAARAEALRLQALYGPRFAPLGILLED